MREAVIHALAAVSAQGTNPIQHMYGSISARGAWRKECHELWQPYLASLPAEFLVQVIQGNEPSDVVYFGVHCPHLSETLQTKYRRRFPRFNRLPALLLPEGTPNAITEEDCLAFRSWEARGRPFVGTFEEFGCFLGEVVPPVPVWDWTPRRITLPQVTLHVDEAGVRHGRTRLAWRLGPNQLFCFSSDNSVAGRALCSQTQNQGLDLFTLQRHEFGGRAFYGEPGEGQRNQLLHYLTLYIFSEEFRWGTAREILDFLSRAPAPRLFQAVREALLLQVVYFEKCTVFGSGDALPRISAIWGGIYEWLELVEAHFPEITPHPDITVMIS